MAQGSPGFQGDRLATNGDSSRIDLLAPKERECLRLVGQQLSSKEIARELGISKASVDTYCNRARAKLGVADRREAARLVLAHDRKGHGGAPAAAPPPQPQPPVAVAGPSLLPPLASVGTGGRIGLIFGGAVFIAIAFGMLLTALQALETLARSAAGLPPASAAPASAPAAPPPAPQPKP